MAATQERFLKDAGNHLMTIKQDDGIFRHLVFKDKDSSAYHFNITTWPGYLCVSGDMGCFVFSRMNDMFDFFRKDDINLGYWAEKLQAANRHSGYEAFSNEKFKVAVKRAFDLWKFDTEEEKNKAWAFITKDHNGPLSCEYSNEHEAHSSAFEWECPVTKQTFADFFEYSLKEYTFHYEWCCRAIVWAIKQYDASKETKLSVAA